LTANTAGKCKAKKPEPVYPVRAFLFGRFLCDFSNGRLGVWGIALPEKTTGGGCCIVPLTVIFEWS
jgi:hypothetical protein